MHAMGFTPKKNFPKRYGAKSAEDEKRVIGVDFVNQFPKDFVRGYGIAVDDYVGSTADNQRKIQTFTCEYLTRQGVALSEALAAFQDNFSAISKMRKVLRQNDFIESYQEFMSNIIQGKFIISVTITSPLRTFLFHAFTALRKFKESPTFDNFNTVRLLWISQTDEIVDSAAATIHEISACMYLPAIHYLVGKHCLSDLSRTAGKFANHIHAADLKQNPTPETYFGTIEPTSLSNKQVFLTYHVSS